MRKQAWNYKSQIVPKNNSKRNNQGGNIEYFKMLNQEDELFDVVYTIAMYSTLTKTDKIEPTILSIGGGEFDINSLKAFAIDLDLKMFGFKGEESGESVMFSIREYLPIVMEQSIDFDKLPRLTKEEFYSLA